MSTSLRPREFWPGAFLPCGLTAIPRWTLDPCEGVAVHTEPVQDELAARVRRLAVELDVPEAVVWLAGHAKVLAALTGEAMVSTGYVLSVADSTPLPCGLDTGPRTWRELVARTGVIETAVRQGFAPQSPRVKPAVHEPLFEVVFDPTSSGAGDAVGECGQRDEGMALWVEIARETPGHGGGVDIRVRYRRDVLDAAAAARVAGYHRRAVELMVTDPDAEHHRQSLVSDEELRYQHEALAGPRRELPDIRCHELFEQQVRAHPDAVAATLGHTSLTYAALNARANRLARALLARGLRAEDVVGVVCERNLDWLVAVLAVFKAGGAYLPIEPRFPAQRIAATLRRAECRYVLTEPGSDTRLGQALESLPGRRPVGVFIESGYREQHAGDDLGVAVAADQLAYIYFTSGSTGEPKGAMCEHAGMLNHLFAKIDDLGIGAGQVVAQTAPQCFDISLWQLLSALVTGGRTLLVEQEVIVDVARFIGTLIDNRVAVVQVVPSYLEAVLSYLATHPRELPDLRCVSVTGEALKAELARRWFTTQPTITLVNAYGLTETSDDTNHEVMLHAPAEDKVPLGRCVQNVSVLVWDEHLCPVPLGAPGLIVFGGVCVGRGYINDPERTRQAYLPDPRRPGQRLYRGGDYGRWRPDGKLEFLGRRDGQVKIAGFRIEIGDIENALLRLPGVRDGAVVVIDQSERGKHLVGFYAAAEALAVEALRDRLARCLPDYMIPTRWFWMPSLPLTDNGKIDKKALTGLAEQHDTRPARDGDPCAVAVLEHDKPAPRTATPRTPTEWRVAQAWATVLGIRPGEIRRHDHFFDRGGTSLSAIKLAIALDRAVSPRDLTDYPVLFELAELIERRAGQW